MNSQVQDLLEKQGSELKQAKQLIPNLQRQVTSLTGQLQCLAEDLAEVTSHYCLPSASYESFGLFIGIFLLSKPQNSYLSCIWKSCTITYDKQNLVKLRQVFC